MPPATSRATARLTLGAVSDPGTDTVTSYIVHWGDGSSDTYLAAGVKTHTYADGPASRSITVDLVDEDGTFLNRANALQRTSPLRRRLAPAPLLGRLTSSSMAGLRSPSLVGNQAAYSTSLLSVGRIPHVDYSGDGNLTDSSATCWAARRSPGV